MPYVRPLPSAAYLRECFDYDPQSGVVHWRTRPRAHFTSDRYHHRANTMWAGKLAGSVAPDGYVKVHLDGKSWAMARIIWRMQTGVDPIEVDHHDRDSMNNKWGNLRQATAGQNKSNCKRTANLTGYKGVYRVHKSTKFYTRVTSNKRVYYVGGFNTALEAYQHRNVLARQLHGAFFHP